MVKLRKFETAKLSTNGRTRISKMLDKFKGKMTVSGSCTFEMATAKIAAHARNNAQPAPEPTPEKGDQPTPKPSRLRQANLTVATNLKLEISTEMVLATIKLETRIPRSRKIQLPYTLQSTTDPRLNALIVTCMAISPRNVQNPSDHGSNGFYNSKQTQLRSWATTLWKKQTPLKLSEIDFKTT